MSLLSGSASNGWLAAFSKMCGSLQRKTWYTSQKPPEKLKSSITKFHGRIQFDRNEQAILTIATLQNWIKHLYRLWWMIKKATTQQVRMKCCVPPVHQALIRDCARCSALCFLMVYFM